MISEHHIGMEGKMKARTILSRILQAYRDKERQAVGAKFIELMEIIYAIILACGVVRIVEVFPGNISYEICGSMVISLLVLVRFFFSPSKNMKIIGSKGEGWRWSIMPWDVPLLMAQALIYYCMCAQVQNSAMFYRYFFVLLIVNSFWLFSILVRLRKERLTYMKIWAVSNLIFFGFYLGTYKVGLDAWVPWFALALSNSLIDLGTTYSDYFRD